MTIIFIPITAALNDSLVDPRQFESRHDVQAGSQIDLIRDLVRQNLVFFESVPRNDPWGGYLTVDAESRAVVGVCAFKSGPTAERTVEIAYCTLPDHEGRGFGTATALELFRIADETGQVDRVIAHTLPETNASNSLLHKAGFNHLGEVIDPEDGRIWQFARDCTDFDPVQSGL